MNTNETRAMWYAKIRMVGDPGAVYQTIYDQELARLEQRDRIEEVLLRVLER